MDIGGEKKNQSDNHRNRLPVTACANAAFLFSLLLFSFTLMSGEKLCGVLLITTTLYVAKIEVSPLDPTDRKSVV